MDNGGGELVEIEGVVYSPISTICGILDITRRDVRYNPDTEIVTFYKNSDIVEVSKHDTVKNGVIIEGVSGYTTVSFIKYCNIEQVVQLFNGSITVNSTEIHVTI